jgi:hypothetical protein
LAVAISAAHGRPSASRHAACHEATVIQDRYLACDRAGAIATRGVNPANRSSDRCCARSALHIVWVQGPTIRGKREQS